MPIYEYRCDACGEEFERLVFSGDEESEIDCPKCGAQKCRRQMSAFATSGEKSPFASAASSAGGCGSGGFS